MISTLYPLAIVAVANIIIGFVWYGPLFGKQWRHYAGISMESIKMHGLPMWQAILGGFIASVVWAFILLQVIRLSGASMISDVWYVAFMLWLGFTLTVYTNSYLWEGKSYKLLLINGGYSLLNTLVASAILAYFL